MITRTSSFSWTKFFNETLLANVSGASSVTVNLSTAKIHQYTDSHVFDAVNDTPASFTEAAYTGYGATSVTFNGPYNQGADGQVLVTDIDSSMSAITGGSSKVQGVYLTDSTGTQLYGAGPLADPVPLVNVGDAIHVDITLGLDYEQLVSEE
jgi:hypothetical protein